MDSWKRMSRLLPDVRKRQSHIWNESPKENICMGNAEITGHKLKICTSIFKDAIVMRSNGPKQLLNTC